MEKNCLQAEAEKGDYVGLARRVKRYVVKVLGVDRQFC